jgi:hypothetical protein
LESPKNYEKNENFHFVFILKGVLSAARRMKSDAAPVEETRRKKYLQNTLNLINYNNQ